MRVMLAGNGSTLNRGCEAIERGTMEVLRAAGCDARYSIASFGPERQGPGAVASADVLRLAGRAPDTRFGLPWMRRHFRGLFGRGDADIRDFRGAFRWLDAEVDACDVVLSVGGDNYTLDYGKPEVFFAFNEYVLKRGKALILWGASVGPFGEGSEYERVCAERLSRVACVAAREDETVEYLASIGVTENVIRVSDPAFVMPPDSLDRNDYQGFVGLNFSPMFGAFAGSGCDWLGICVAVVRHLVRVLGLRVVLVPHVTLPSSNDWDFMRQVSEEAGCGDAVRLLPPTLTARHLKAIMGQLRCFAGARMHATIGAISMGVPTVSLSYSRKSVGLNREVYGNTELVVGSDRVSAEAIVEVIESALAEDDLIRARLESVLPSIRCRAIDGGRFVREARWEQRQ